MKTALTIWGFCKSSTFGTSYIIIVIKLALVKIMAGLLTCWALMKICFIGVSCSSPHPHFIDQDTGTQRWPRPYLWSSVCDCQSQDPNFAKVTPEQNDYQPHYVIPVPSAYARKLASKRALCSMCTVARFDIVMTTVYNSHLHFLTRQG